MLELIFKDIKDIYTQENFFRIRKHLNENVFFEGDFKIFDITIPGIETDFIIKHGLTFIPADIINLSFEGNGNYYFNYQKFDRENLYVTTHGPVRIRFLAGKLRDPTTSGIDQDPFPYVQPGDVVAPSSPGFVYTAINKQKAGFWLTNDGVPTNVVGIPVMFGDSVVVQAAVGDELEDSYTISIYQHQGNEVGLAFVGDIEVTAGGPKRFDLEYLVPEDSPNIQLACRLVAGETKNLKVSLVVKGTVA